MKQYLTQDQTAKLIELGFEKPRTKIPFEVGNEELGYAYSIGELIEMLDDILLPMQIYIEKGLYSRNLTIKAFVDGMWCKVFNKQGGELIDLFFEAIVKMKRERVI